MVSEISELRNPSPAAADGLAPVRTRAQVIERIRGARPVLDRLGVGSLALFGSAARDQLAASSDIDILVRFAGRPTFDAFMDVKLELEGRLGRRVDLVTPGAVKPRLAALIEQDLLHVAYGGRGGGTSEPSSGLRTASAHGR
jgi:uncharacterized protein